jgi:peptidyl-prolyl cis-trans isomerase B (cyclophilin B)
MKKSISVIAIILSMVMVLASCGTNQNDKDEEPVSTPDPELVKNTVNATIELEDGDEIMLELYPDLAPDTVENFVELAEDGFYDGTIFHRVIEDFMIQGGGYDENLKEQKTESIKGEFAKNGFENTLSHTRGVISMARAQDYDSATSQFFIVQKDATYLDGQYAAFGRVTEGMDIVDEIASVKTGTVASSNMEDPIEPIVIDTITIDTSVSSGKSSKTKATSKPSKDKDTDKNSKDTDDEDEDTSSSKSSKSPSKSTTAPKSTPKSNSSSKSSSSNSSSSSKSNSSNDDELSEDELNDILPFLQSDSTESNS